jgi:hypothetical protein
MLRKVKILGDLLAVPLKLYYQSKMVTEQVYLGSLRRLAPAKVRFATLLLPTEDGLRRGLTWLTCPGHECGRTHWC